MPANVETMFSGNNEVPWHGIGKVVAGTLTSAEAIEAAGLNWVVLSDKVQGVSNGLVIPGYKMLYRDSDMSPLAIVGEKYRPLQNSEAFDFTDGIVGEGYAAYETAGSLDNGKRIWVLANLPGDITLPGNDRIQKRLLFATSHDGSLSTIAKLVATRVVCANTLASALFEKGAEVKVRHTKNASSKLAEAHRILGLASERFNNMQRNVEVLANTRFSEKNMAALAEHLFPADENNVVSGRAVNARESLMSLFVAGTGNKGVTAWDAENAVSEYVDHKRTTRVTGTAVKSDLATREARLNSVWFGSGAAMKDVAHAYIMEQIASRPMVSTLPA